MTPITAYAPGRVNLIGDHTDYTGGWCLPIALQWGTTVTGTSGGDRIVVGSDLDGATVTLPRSGVDPASLKGWARFVAAVVTEVRPSQGFTGRISTTLPVGAGLSSSAALEIALALALGFDGDPLALAETARRAEFAAVGVPCGIMDQLASTCGRAGHALLIDCDRCTVEDVAIPEGADICIIDPGQPRSLADSAYAERRAACAAAAEVIGPLRDATFDAVAAIPDEILRRRARHVVTENQRVLDTVAALRDGDWPAVGQAMLASHRSLRDDFEVSTPLLDETVDRLARTPGVFGARLTGAGFGGSVVAVCEVGALSTAVRVIPSQGAHRRP